MIDFKGSVVGENLRLALAATNRSSWSGFHFVYIFSSLECRCRKKNLPGKFTGGFDMGFDWRVAPSVD